MNANKSNYSFLYLLELFLRVVFVALFLGYLGFNWFISAYRPTVPDVENGFVISLKGFSRTYYVTSFEKAISDDMILAGTFCGIGMFSLKLRRRTSNG